MCGYYCKFIDSYSEIIKLITEFLLKDKQFIWTQNQEKSFRTSISKFTSSELILRYADFEQPFFLTTDASQYAIGSVLSQKIYGIQKPICYASRTLNSAETRYATPFFKLG